MDHTARIALEMQLIPTVTPVYVTELMIFGCQICGEHFTTRADAERHAERCWELEVREADLQHINIEDEERAMSEGRTYRQAMEHLLEELYTAWDAGLERPLSWAPLY
jgi:hypothetical protein